MSNIGLSKDYNKKFKQKKKWRDNFSPLLLRYKCINNLFNFITQLIFSFY